MMKRVRLTRKCRVALISIAVRYLLGTDLRTPAPREAIRAGAALHYFCFTVEVMEPITVEAILN
jgi:hypothetical protein